MSITLRPHGTRGRYKQGCHCDLCTTAQRAYQQAWRDRNKAVGLTSNGTVPIVRPKRIAIRSLSFARHGTVERYRQNCTCKPCTRAYDLHQRIVQTFPSVKEQTKSLTSTYEQGFVRLWRDILGPDDELTAAILERIRKRVQRRLSREFYGTQCGAPTAAAKDIAAMSYDQIKMFMQPGIPSIAQTRRTFHTIDY